MTTGDMISTGFPHSCEDCETLLFHDDRYDFNKFSTKNRPYGGIKTIKKGILGIKARRPTAYGDEVMT